MAGGVYCPLSPRDPPHRLHTLVQQTQSRLVLVHDLTKTKFDHNIALPNIDSILIVNNMERNIDIDQLSSIRVTLDDLAYIIFTSGSTGTPKAVQVRHKNFIQCMHSLTYINSFNRDDTVVQMTRCSFDIHVQEILGTLLVGSTLIMLHSGGTIDFKPLSNYRCMVINQYSQSSVTDEEGELCIGGVGVFVGYLGRDDLTAKVLIEIDGELFYRTGDLVRMDSNGLLHYQGRKDHQIKLHGQRIELGEIERCLLNVTSISACVVLKWNNDYLVAYVQSSSHNNEEQLSQHCESHLPPHMIPSFFIILEKLPLNPNGKVDRKQLPSPDFSSSPWLSSDKSDTPLNQFEEQLLTIWRQVLHSNENHISRTTSFFSVGGHSLLFIELYYRYQLLFNFDVHSLSIGLFLQQPTIRQHAQLLQALPSNDTQTTQWQTLNINQGKTFLN
ncbi:unnamed protein product [Adineta steineri]|uniref:Carrier domain-containing protein n=1 Tax=Adineta steineri TaxID=433720 RepID=A0A815Q8A9_9BILA|nr:unnamed protein product [Adineta steineri]CAF1632889.1 unnamed protein product [Adineta steineri]